MHKGFAHPCTEEACYSDCCLTILHCARGATSTRCRAAWCRTPKEIACTLVLIGEIKGVSHTYLTALRLRHFSPEEHAAGRVLNSHKSLQKKKKTCSHLTEVKREQYAPPRCPGCLSSLSSNITLISHITNCSVCVL